MDEQKKQKVLIGVLAVAALGAGGYWFTRPAPETVSLRTPGAAKVERRKAKKPAVDDSKKPRRKSVEVADKDEKVARRKRPEAERKTSTQRTKARGRAKQVKKEKLYPAG